MRTVQSILSATMLIAMVTVSAVRSETPASAPANNKAAPTTQPTALSDEAAKLRVALAEVDVEVAKIKLHQTQFDVERGKVGMANAELAQSEADLATLYVKAAEIKLAQARIGVTSSEAPAPVVPDAESAKLQLAQREVELEIAQVKAKYALNRFQVANMGVGRVSPEDVSGLEVQSNLAALQVKLAQIKVDQAKLIVVQATKQVGK